MSERPLDLNMMADDPRTIRHILAKQSKGCHKPGVPGVLDVARNLPQFDNHQNPFRKEALMNRILILLAVGAGLAAGGITFAHRHDDGERVKVLSVHEIQEKLDGQNATATIVEVTIEPGQSGAPHRHPGSGFVYVLEGQYEFGIDDQPTRVFKAGESFYEPSECLHRVSKNPAANGRTRLIAVMLHPRDAKDIAIPETSK